MLKTKAQNGFDANAKPFLCVEAIFLSCPGRSRTCAPRDTFGHLVACVFDSFRSFRIQRHGDTIGVMSMRGLRRAHLLWSIGLGALLEILVLLSLMPKDSTQPPTRFQELLGYTRIHTRASQCIFPPVRYWFRPAAR